MSDPEDLIEKHFRVLEASATAGFGRYMRPVMLGSAHLVLAAAVREAYDQGRLDAALALKEQERRKRDESWYFAPSVHALRFRP